MVSFERANIEWNNKYKRYQGHNTQVLSFFGDDTVLLQMENGKVYKFPQDCIKTSEANRDNIEGDHTTRGHCKKKLPRNEVTRDEFNSSISSGELLSRKRHNCLRSKGPGETHNKQPVDLTSGKSVKKDYREVWAVLVALKLQKYYRNLIIEGFESLSYLKDAEFDDLIAVGMKRGHARRLLKAMKKYCANPSYDFNAEGSLQGRMSFHSSRSSLTSSSSSWYNSSISRLSIPEYELYAPDDLENFQNIDSLTANNSERFSYRQSQHGFEAAGTRRRWIKPSLSESPSIGIYEDNGYLIIPFNKRPLGFNIMSPLSVGTMVSSITDELLKKKGLSLGLPILQIMDFDVSRCNAEEVANVLSFMDVPFTITFGLKPYFEPGQKVMVLKNDKWWPCTVEKMSRSARNVIVKYENCPFKLNNIEKISDYNRIEHFDHDGMNFPRQTFPHKSDNVQTQMSHKVVSSGGRYVRDCDEAQKQSKISPSGSAGRHQSHIVKSKEQLPGVRRGNLAEHAYLTNTENKTTHPNLKKNVSFVILGSLSDVV